MSQPQERCGKIHYRKSRSRENGPRESHRRRGSHLRSGEARTPSCLHHLVLSLAVVGCSLVLGFPGEAPAQGIGEGGGSEPDGSVRVLTLSEAIRVGLGDSRDLTDARMALEAAEEQVRDAWGNVYPSVDFSAGYTRNISPQVSFLPAQIFNPEAGEGEFIPVQFGADNTWQSTVQIEQPLFEAQAFLGVGAAARYRGLQEESLRGRTQEVVTRIRLAYYEALLAREEVRLTENSLQRVEEALEETRALNRAGLTSDYDVLRLEVERANLEPNLRRARNEALQARRELAVELGMSDLEGVEVAGSLASLELEEPGENTPENRELLTFAGIPPGGEPGTDDAIQRALASSSEMRQQEATEELRRTELRVEQTRYLPRISLFGTYNIQAQQNGSPEFFGSGSMDRAYSRMAGIQVSIPVFNGFQREAQIGRVRAQLRQAQAQKELGRDRTTAEVKRLLEEVEETRQRAGAQAQAVEQARRGYGIASAQFREGVGSRLELTDAEGALRESEFNYARAAFDYLAARARLDRILGQVPLVDVTPAAH